MAITRFKNSSILNRGPKYNDFLAGLPFRPIIGTATDGGTGTTVSVAFTGNNPAGAGITYTALSSPGNITATGPASPITVSGLTAGTAYTFQVKAGNSLGDSAYSASSNSVTPVTPTAFESIATVTASGGETSLTFSNIPGTYQHLQIRGIAKDSFNDNNYFNLGLRFNSDTGNNYAWHRLVGNGSTASASGQNSQPFMFPGIFPYSGSNQTSTFGAMILDIHDYANTSKNKTVKSFSGSDWNQATTNARIYLTSGLWMSTAAITSITLINGDVSFAAGSTFALYGIKA